MNIQESRWVSVRDERLVDVVGIGDTLEDAFANYKIDIIKKKKRTLMELENINKIEEEIESMIECGLPFVTVNKKDTKEIIF